MNLKKKKYSLFFMDFLVEKTIKNLEIYVNMNPTSLTSPFKVFETLTHIRAF